MVNLSGLDSLQNYSKVDNEISKVLVKAIKGEDLNYQLVAPCDHQLDLAEWVNQFVNNYFISILVDIDTNFPTEIWNLLLPHTEVTLNISHPLCINSKISAYTLIYGTLFLWCG